MIDTLKKGISIIQKAFIVIAVYFVVINLFFHFSSNKPVNTVDTVKENRIQIYKNINDPKLNSTKEGKQQIALYKKSLCALMGEACTNNPNDGEANFHRSFFGGMSQLITMTYANPPASGFYWAYDSLKSIGFIPKTYASEGIGFASIKPLANLWLLFRNVSYAFLVIILIAIGFMIMFRLKINPQTVISIENSLPRIIFALVLITFSFAIGGFLIDLMYVATAFLITVISNNGIYNLNQATQTALITSGGVGKLFNLIFWNADVLQVGGAILSLLPTFLNSALRTIISGGALFLLHKVTPIGEYLLDGKAGTGTFDFIGFFISLIAWVIVGGVTFLFAPLLLSIFILITTGLIVFFRLFFLLFKAYLRILFYILFSPFILLLEAIPGRNMFGKWLKSIVSDLMLFPLVITLIAISAIIIRIPQNNNPLWQPPFLYSANPVAFNVLVSIGLLYMIPDIAALIKEAMGIKKGSIPLGLGTFFAGAAAGAGGIMGGASRFAGFGYQVNQILGSGPVGNLLKKAPGVGWLMNRINKVGGQAPTENT